MSLLAFLRSGAVLVPVVFAAATLAACTTNREVVPATATAPTAPDPGTEEAPSDVTATPIPMGNTPPLKAGLDPAIAKELKAGGVDINKLPESLDVFAKETDHVKLHAVMKSFTIALGTTCEGCHIANPQTLEDYQTDTPRKEIARKMWSRFVLGLKHQDGSQVFCDTCHQGSFTFLDRTDKGALANWMQANFVNGLTRTDGEAHACATCHGEGTPAPFLESWKQPESE